MIGKIRIIQGLYRGLHIQTPPGSETRPTADKVREALFQYIVAHQIAAPWEEQVVLDLFAGSGANGIEALSRGAKALHALDRSPAAIKTIGANLEALRVQQPTFLYQKTLQKDAPTFSPTPTLLFCDPPYALDATHMLQNYALTNPGPAVLCYEHGVETKPVLKKPWKLRERRTWGKTTISIFHLESKHDDA